MNAENKTLRTLIIEDHEDDAMLLLDVLKRGGYDITFLLVDTSTSLGCALEQEWDIIFCDHSMPTMNGLEALSIVRKKDQDVPFIFVSGTIGEDVAVNAMRNGAQDYIMKDNLKRLLPAVQRELHECGMRKARRKAEQHLHYLAHFDSLTGLPNRFHFIEQIEAAIAESKVTNDSKLVAVIYLDLDRFKTINDSLGYDAGNQLLKKVAERLSNCIGSKGIAARLATDEFALILKSVLSRVEITNFVQTVFYTLQIPFSIYNLSMFFSASIGVAIYPKDASNATDLLGNADIATYRIKSEGGKGYRFYTPDMSVQLEEQLALERSMRAGLENEEFFLHYQPQLELATGNIVGLEALVRWNHADKGLISPANFIPLAEETGFILPLGEWVLRQACGQIKHWQKIYSHPLKMAVNISARQFHDENLANLVKQVLQENELEAKYLELEITESTFMRNIEKAVLTLKKIKELGISVALDDFGTGYSSLAYLRTFKTDYLKIDQSFIREIPENDDDKEIVSAIIAMASKLSLKTIAEGVETEAQYNFLKEQGCDIVQGYYIARPALPKTITALLTNSPENG